MKENLSKDEIEFLAALNVASDFDGAEAVSDKLVVYGFRNKEFDLRTVKPKQIIYAIQGGDSLSYSDYEKEWKNYINQIRKGNMEIDLKSLKLYRKYRK